MQIKVFRAANLQAALEEIRESLGPNASVLKTRQCRDGWMGWLGRSYVEVTASASDTESALPTGDARLAESSLALPHSAGAWNEEEDLLSLGVSPATVERWMRSTAGFLSAIGETAHVSRLEHLKQTVAREIRLSGPIQIPRQGRRVVALVGPTGVGKTTTIAKLAAGFRVRAQRRVGLLTIDTFRIAAIQQLRAYAQIMDLPMSVVESAEQMPRALAQLGDVDLILIDTTGRSPKGDHQLDGLAELLRTARPDETHLVVSATSTAAVVQSALEGFASAQPTAAIVTKLDETPYTAGVLSALTTGGGFPISYITNGQQVPEDIAVATTDHLVARLLPTRLEVQQFEAA
ncbi:MAG: flagellar biosynthesis protein FlhF [Planctomycetota bacterium]